MLSFIVALAMSGASQGAPDYSGSPSRTSVEMPKQNVPVRDNVENGLGAIKSSEWKFHNQETLAFTRMDRDKNDVVTRRELRSYYFILHKDEDMSDDRKLGKVRSSVAAYLRAYDVDNSGDISFSEVAESDRFQAGSSDPTNMKPLSFD